MNQARRWAFANRSLVRITHPLDAPSYADSSGALGDAFDYARMVRLEPAARGRHGDAVTSLGSYRWPR